MRFTAAVRAALAGASMPRSAPGEAWSKVMGAPLMLVCGNVSPHTLDDPARAAADLAALAERAAVLLDAGYDGTVSHEIFSDEFRSGSPQQVAVDGICSMLWLEETATADAAARAKAGSLASGVEFVEFTAEGAEAAWLSGLLQSVGFRRTHVHRSKQVSLYRQGDVSVIINSEPGSFAHSYHERHGTSVCALAVATPGVTCSSTPAPSTASSSMWCSATATPATARPTPAPASPPSRCSTSGCARR
jgi:hypothetical protein